MGLAAGWGEQGGKTVTTPTLEPRPQLLRDARLLAWGWRTCDLTPSPLKVRQAEELLTKQRGARAAQLWPPQSPPVLFPVLFPAPQRGNLSPSEGRDERRSDLLFYSIMPVSRETNYGALLY